MMSILQFEFMRHAFTAAVLCSIACGVIGAFVVVQRLAFISGGITHAAFGGLGLGYFLGVNLIYAMTPFTLAAAFVIGLVSEYTQSDTDSAIGMLWVFGMALGVLLLGLTKGYTPDLMSYLFGNILTVPKSDLVLMAVMDVAILLMVGVFYRGFTAVAFDAVYAKTAGVRVFWLRQLMLCLVAITVVMLTRIVGIILVMALLTIPASMARELTHHLKKMILGGIMFGLIFTVLGLVISYYLNLASGATIVMTACLGYGLTFACKKIYFFARRRPKLVVSVGMLFIVFAGVPVFAADMAEMEARIAELEARLDQYKPGVQPQPDSHDHHTGHSHAGFTALNPHGGLDFRFARSQGAKNTFMVHEAVIGYEAQFSNNLSSVVDFAAHLHDGAEAFHIHEAYLAYHFSETPLQVKAGKYRVPFGFENSFCFYDRRTVLPSLMTIRMLGDHGWYDTGLAVDYDFLSVSVLQGQNGILFGESVSAGADADEAAIPDNNNLPLVLHLKRTWEPVTLGASYGSGAWDENDAYNSSLANLSMLVSDPLWDVQAEYMTLNRTGSEFNQHHYAWYLMGALHCDAPELFIGFKPFKQMEFLLSYSQADTDTYGLENQWTLQLGFVLPEGLKWRSGYIAKTESSEQNNNQMYSQLAYEF